MSRITIYYFETFLTSCFYSTIFYDRIKGDFNQKDEVMNNLIELQDVNLIRNGKDLLKEINWQVKENDVGRF